MLAVTLQPVSLNMLKGFSHKGSKSKYTLDSCSEIVIIHSYLVSKELTAFVIRAYDIYIDPELATSITLLFEQFLAGSKGSERKVFKTEDSHTRGKLLL